MPSPIEDYIRANGQRYTREAIRAALVEAGHDPAEIDRVWEAIQRDQKTSNLVSWAKALYVLGFVIVAGGGLVFFLFMEALEGQGTASPLGFVLSIGAYAALGFGLVQLTRSMVEGSNIGGFVEFAAYVGVLVATGTLVAGSCLAGGVLLGA
ncbi:MAG: hypothetical protein ACRDFZ_03385 [Candidatus Limnocylindria bacterium]